MSKNQNKPLATATSHLTMPPLAVTMAIDRATGAYSLAHNIALAREVEDLTLAIAALERTLRELRNALVEARVAREVAAKTAPAEAPKGEECPS